MADERRARVEGSISPTAVAWFVVGGGILLLGWKLLGTLSAGSETAKALSRAIQEEAKEALEYTASGAYDEAGLEIRKVSLDDKIKVLKIVSQNWLTRTLDAMAGWLRTYGIYVAWPAVALVGSYLVYKLVKNWPKGGPPRFHCDQHNVDFPTKEALQLHNETQHQPQYDADQLNTAWAMFRNQPSFVQDAVALEFVSGTRVYQNWQGLSPQQVTGLATAIQAVMAYGIAATLQSLIPALLLAL